MHTIPYGKPTKMLWQTPHIYYGKQAREVAKKDFAYCVLITKLNVMYFVLRKERAQRYVSCLVHNFECHSRSATEKILKRVIFF